MGITEAFLIGGVVGGGSALVVYLVLANAAKGRSTTAFALAGWTTPSVLAAAQAYFNQLGLRVRAVPGGLTAEVGSKWATGIRVLEVRTQDREGGVDVWVAASIRGFYPDEIHVNPNSMFGVIPRRKAFRLAQGLAAALGVPGAIWQHGRARTA